MNKKINIIKSFLLIAIILLALCFLIPILSFYKYNGNKYIKDDRLYEISNKIKGEVDNVSRVKFYTARMFGLKCKIYGKEITYEDLESMKVIFKDTLNIALVDDIIKNNKSVIEYNRLKDLEHIDITVIIYDDFISYLYGGQDKYRIYGTPEDSESWNIIESN